MAESIWNPNWWGPSNKPNNEPFTRVLSEVTYGGEVVLDVGCGNQKIAPRLLGVDAYDEAADVKAYMWEMPFADNSVDGILCFHALEHISKYKIPDTLDEFQRILKPGARFIIMVPDLEWVLNAFLQNPTHDWEMDMIFGSQTAEGQFHKTGFTERIIRSYFEIIPKCEIIQIFKVDAYRQVNYGILARKKPEEVEKEKQVASDDVWDF